VSKECWTSAERVDLIVLGGVAGRLIYRAGYGSGADPPASYDSIQAKIQAQFNYTKHNDSNIQETNVKVKRKKLLYVTMCQPPKQIYSKYKANTYANLKSCSCPCPCTLAGILVKFCPWSCSRYCEIHEHCPLDQRHTAFHGSRLDLCVADGVAHPTNCTQVIALCDSVPVLINLM
jgi:hypothetical protein